jgi:hypothetical protein
MRGALAAIAVVACVGLPAFGQQATTPAVPASFGSLPLQRGEPRASAFGWGEVLGGIVLLALLAGGVKYARTRREGGGPARAAWWPAKPASGSLRTTQSVRLVQGATLHVVEWGDEELLLACTPGAVTVVSRRARTPVASHEAEATR